MANVAERRLAPPRVAVSTVIFTIDWAENSPRLVLPLVRRIRPPFKGQWALPGGPLGPEESLVSAAEGNLVAMTGVSPSYLEQLYTFGDLARSPQERTVSIVYWALVPPSARTVSDDENVKWFDADTVGELAFDHNAIVEYALARLRTKVAYADIAYRFLGPTFTLSQVHEVYEAVLGQRVDPGNFRRRLKREQRIAATEDFVRSGAHRPARLYRYLKDEQ